jgi:hypothetical protein
LIGSRIFINGLTPRERSSGLRRRLGAISKRGDVYIRMLLTHGGRAVLWNAKSRNDPDRLRAWALNLERTRGHNRAAIALANKLARIVWAVWPATSRSSSRPRSLRDPGLDPNALREEDNLLTMGCFENDAQMANRS